MLLSTKEGAHEKIAIFSFDWTVIASRTMRQSKIKNRVEANRVISYMHNLVAAAKAESLEQNCDYEAPGKTPSLIARMLLTSQF